MGTENPCQAPESIVKPNASDVAAPKVFGNIFTWCKWLSICNVSGGISFVFGLVYGGFTVPVGLAMIAGIVSFAFAYVWLESTKFIESCWAGRRVRRTIVIGYTTRIVASIVFPIGFYVDVYCGLCSVWLCETILHGASN